MVSLKQNNVRPTAKADNTWIETENNYDFIIKVEYLEIMRAGKPTRGTSRWCRMIRGLSMQNLTIRHPHY
jgi:hypothetical protein